VKRLFNQAIYLVSNKMESNHDEWLGSFIE
jgi:hypothetical protein